MPCTYDDGYYDARHRRGREDCDCDDYGDGYRAGQRANRRDQEAREERERMEAEAFEQAQYEQAMREAYERECEEEQESSL